MTLNLPLDPKLSALINQRRIAEEQRKARIFNPRQRLIGIDADALNEQVHDEKLRKYQEDEKNRMFSENLRKCDRMAVLLQKKQEDEMRKLKEDIDRFRLTEQKPEFRREFDLYDPNMKKKELPPRISDDDPRCSISGMQKLEGEDINYKERTKMQKLQCREWLKDQMLNKRMELDKHNAEMTRLEQRLQELDQHAFLLAVKEGDCRRKVAEATSEFNRNLAEQQKESKKQKEISDELDKLQEIYNAFYGDFLSENSSAARSSFGPHRIVPDRWKGMTKEQLEEYYAEQKEQIFENKRRKEKEKKEASQWDKLQLSQSRQAILLERAENRNRQQQEKERILENNRLAQDQRLKKDYLEKVVYSNVPTEDFFAQFNTSTR